MSFGLRFLTSTLVLSIGTLLASILIVILMYIFKEPIYCGVYLSKLSNDYVIFQDIRFAQDNKLYETEDPFEAFLVFSAFYKIVKPDQRCTTQRILRIDNDSYSKFQQVIFSIENWKYKAHSIREQELIKMLLQKLRESTYEQN